VKQGWGTGKGAKLQAPGHTSAAWKAALRKRQRQDPPFRKGGAPEKARQTAKSPRAPRTFFQMRALSRRARAPWATNSAGKTSGLPPKDSGTTWATRTHLSRRTRKVGHPQKPETAIPGDTPVPPGRRRYEKGESRTHPSERVGHPKNQHKKHKAFLCAKSAVTLLTRESSW